MYLKKSPEFVENTTTVHEFCSFLKICKPQWILIKTIDM